MEVVCFDESVNYKFFLKHILHGKFIKFFQYLGYRFFFDGKKRKHIKKNIIPKGTFLLNHEINSSDIDSIINENSSENLFFKIDIEGSEYRILSQLIKHSSHISGLVIEFHDCDTRLNEIKHFVEKIGLKLIHVHANNWAPIRIEDSLPTVLELTFSKHANIENESFLPHKYDMPCNKLSNEIKLEFAK